MLDRFRADTRTRVVHDADVRDWETIDGELRLLAAVRRAIREHGGEPSSRPVDEPLDERSALNPPACLR